MRLVPFVLVVMMSLLLFSDGHPWRFAKKSIQVPPDQQTSTEMPMTMTTTENIKPLPPLPLPEPVQPESMFPYFPSAINEILMSIDDDFFCNLLSEATGVDAEDDDSDDVLSEVRTNRHARRDLITSIRRRWAKSIMRNSPNGEDDDNKTNSGWNESIANDSTVSLSDVVSKQKLGNDDKPTTKISMDSLRKFRYRLLRGFSPEKLMSIRRILLNNLSVSELQTALRVVYSSKFKIAEELSAEINAFYISSGNSMSEHDNKRLLVDLILVVNGRADCPTCQINVNDKQTILDALITGLLPREMMPEEAKMVRTNMKFLILLQKNSDELKNDVKAFLAKVIQDETSNDTSEESHARRERSLFDILIFGDSATCRLLEKFADNSSNCAVRYISGAVYNALECSTEAELPASVITNVARTTTASIPQHPLCGVSDGDALTTPPSTSLSRRVVGGELAESCHALPWMVRLDVGCGGAVLDAYTILTAAHCVSGRPTSYLKAYVGEYDTETTEGTEQVFTITMDAQHVRPHPDFDKLLQINDIAVLKLDTPIDFTHPCAKPICLDSTYQIQPGQECTIAGWGATSENAHTPPVSRFLRSASIPVFEGGDCVSKFTSVSPYYFTDLDHQVCAGQPLVGGVDTCTGDSGAPIVCLNQSSSRWVALGLVSFGEGCARPNIPSVYTDVRKYDSWIAAQLGNL